MNISFSMTTAQVEQSFATGDVQKDVTRRNGWRKLKPGQILNACEKCQGIKAGEKVRVLGQIRVISVRQEKLSELLKPGAYGQEEVRREGFKQWSPRIFVDFFLRGHKGVTLYTDITRIEFEYLPRRNDLGEKTVLNINPVGAE